MLHSGGRNQFRPTPVLGGYIALSPGGSPMIQSGAQNQNRPTTSVGWYTTPTVPRITNSSEHGTKQRSGPQVGPLAT